jgi:uncharacterized membrane protein YkvA (DUF1232 family)
LKEKERLVREKGRQ